MSDERPGEDADEPRRVPEDQAEESGECDPAAAPGPPTGTALADCRLHPVAAALAALDSVRDAIVSVVVLLVIGSQSGRLGTFAAFAAVAGAVVAVTVGIARWRAETYAVVDATVRHRRGLISREETVVPLARVHSIDTAQGPLQRLFGVYELHVQTAGGGARGEIVLRAVAPAETRRLRAAAGLPVAPATPDLPRWRLTGRDLVVVGLTAPQIGIVLPVAAAIVAFGDRILGETGIRDTLVESAPTEASGIALVALVAIAAAWLLAFAGSLVAFAGFSVVRDGDHLRIERGFLQRRATTVPLARVHAVSVAEGPLRRPFALCSVRLETAGYGSESGAARTLFPLLRSTELDTRLAELVPGLAPQGAATAAWQRPPRRALRRYVLALTVAGVAAVAVAAAIWPAAAAAVPLLALAGALLGSAGYRSAGWRLADGRLAARHGALTRRTVLVSAGRLQHHSLAQSPFQRRARLATFSVTVASGTGATVRHLELTAAQGLFDSLRPLPDR